MSAPSKDGSPAWPRNLNLPLPRRYRTFQLLVFGALVFNIILSCVKLADRSLENYMHRLEHEEAQQRLPYNPMPLSGYLNSGKLDHFECKELAHSGRLEIQQSFHLHDDIFEIAESMAQHPMVSSHEPKEGETRAEMVRRTWTRFSQSSVWLADQRIHLAVTRVIFYPSGARDVPSISFIRGQTYDEYWEELRNYTVYWRGEAIIFPRVFDIPAPYAVRDVWFGPEDPRIVVEEGVDGAEPVIIFNMISDLTAKAREMHAYRPFSGAFTVLSMEDKFERSGSEKNWAPFFYKDSNRTRTGSQKRVPDHYIHFLYEVHPFTVLKCNLLSGFCKRAYRETLAETNRHKDLPGRMSGGTQFVPLRTDDVGVVSFIGFPRTHMNAGCAGALYRPELMLMTATESSFHVDYVSSPIDFKDLGMEPLARADPCGDAGRILIANSIARWKRQQDVLELTFSVADTSTQVIRIRGVREHVESLERGGLPDPNRQGDLSAWSLIGQDVVGCSILSAEGYGKEIALSTAYRGVDLLKVEADRDKKLKELEDKIGIWELESAATKEAEAYAKEYQEQLDQDQEDREKTSLDIQRAMRLKKFDEQLQRLEEATDGRFRMGLEKDLEQEEKLFREKEEKEKLDREKKMKEDEETKAAEADEGEGKPDEQKEISMQDEAKKAAEGGEGKDKSDEQQRESRMQDEEKQKAEGERKSKEQQDADAKTQREEKAKEESG